MSLLSYIEHSAAIVGGLDPEEIGDMSVGDAVYENNFTVQHMLGKVLVAGEPLHLAIELPAKRCTAQMLFLARLEQIGYMLEEGTDMMQHLPSFVGAVASGPRSHYWAGAVLTEDFTEGGKYALNSQPPTGNLAENCVQFDIPVSGPHSLDVAAPQGRENIVSFFPPPARIPRAERNVLDDLIQRSQEDLTLAIDEDSRLAARLRAEGK